ncbi:hypothetical protein [Halobaculum sp. MBLA0143]|uniref:hypothetical protein n=1 Tax=Halobaculum sp. MBLA0143 TaxID=3079933 RepID=UPI00352566CB
MTDDGPKLTVRGVTAVAEDATVRHVDQLSPSARRGLQALTIGETRAVAGLEPGEIVVAHSYFRVVQAETAADERETSRVQV